MSKRTWIRQTVDDGPDTGILTSIFLDQIANPHIFYLDFGNENPMYAYFKGGFWHIETVESNTAVGGSISASMDRCNRPHLCYYDKRASLLRYSYRRGQEEWSSELIDGTEDAGFAVQLALDHRGNPCISYLDLQTGEVRYGERMDNGWHFAVIDLVCVGKDECKCDISLAIGNDNRPHILYSDSGKEILQYARRDIADWHIEVIDFVGEGGDNSLALDENCAPHAAYYDLTLKYAHRINGYWHKEVVDNSGNVGYWPSIALDGKNRPHISYFDVVNGRLKYARLSGEAWHIETVDSYPTDSGDRMGAFTSLVLDGKGIPHISYCDCSKSNLRYATVVK